MRLIPITRSTAEASSCGDENGEVPKLNLPLVRREFLKGSGILMGTILTGSVLAALAPSPVWAVELTTLSQAQGKTLMAMGRVLYPHKKLPDAVYALLAKDLDAKAAADPATAALLKDGIASLDKASEDNERHLYLMRTESGQTLAFVQIAGLIARRILCLVREGQTLTRGERFGLIRFGSRVDVYLPPGVEPCVRVGQIMVAGETPIARL